LIPGEEPGDPPAHPGRIPAAAALVVGFLYALVSAYWAGGGTRLLSTVGGTLESAGRARTARVVGLLWVVVVLKVVAAALPLLAVRPNRQQRMARAERSITWFVGLILALYGLVLTLTELLVESGVVHAGRGTDHRALAYHAFLWDPWFLVWGLLVLAALRRSGGPARLRPTRT
jgi:Protein of unknown function (DUF3995)